MANNNELGGNIWKGEFLARLMPSAFAQLIIFIAVVFAAACYLKLTPLIYLLGISGILIFVAGMLWFPSIFLTGKLSYTAFKEIMGSKDNPHPIQDAEIVPPYRLVGPKNKKLRRLK